MGRGRLHCGMGGLRAKILGWGADSGVGWGQHRRPQLRMVWGMLVLVHSGGGKKHNGSWGC